MSKSPTTKPKSKKQLIRQIGFPANSGFQEMADKILKDPENYKIEGSPFNLKTSSNIFSQACAIGLEYMINHPKQAPSDAETNLLAQKIADQLFARLDARFSNLYEILLANYLNEKGTNLYTKNIFHSLAEKFGKSALNVSLNKLAETGNKNIDFLLEEEARQLGKKLGLNSSQPTLKQNKTTPKTKQKQKTKPEQLDEDEEDNYTDEEIAAALE